ILKLIQYLVHAGEETGFDAQRGCVVLQELIGKRLKSMVVRSNAESGFQHAACSGRDMRTKCCQRQGRLSVTAQYEIDGASEIGCGSGQRAGKVEGSGVNQCGGHARDSSRRYQSPATTPA